MTYAWEGVPAGVWCWHIHHEIPCEMSMEPLDARAAFIRWHKAEHEHAARLGAMRGEVLEAVAKPRFDQSRARKHAVPSPRNAKPLPHGRGSVWFCGSPASSPGLPG